MVDEHVELIGGPEKRDVAPVPADPSWPDAFDRHRVRILGALGDRARRVDHIGSTSVPGLAAKPIIDIDLSVVDPDDEAAYLDDLLDAGYELRVREPGHRLVRTPDRDVHVHVCAAGGRWERRHLLFRDWLRRDRADREAYAALKHRLAERDWPTMNHYAAAKGELIAEIAARAEAWARRAGWVPDAGRGGFDLVRRTDGLRYRFEQAGEHHGRPRYRRTDGAVECRWVPPRGWCTVGSDGVPNGWPLEPTASARPTEGPWRSAKGGSRKAARSYLYDLVLDGGTPTP